MATTQSLNDFKETKRTLKKKLASLDEQIEIIENGKFFLLSQTFAQINMTKKQVKSKIKKYNNLSQT